MLVPPAAQVDEKVRPRRGYHHQPDSLGASRRRSQLPTMVLYRRVGSIKNHQRIMHQLVKFLFTHDRIITTQKRAELAGQIAERLITTAKKDTPKGWTKIWGYFGVRTTCDELAHALTVHAE